MFAVPRNQFKGSFKIKNRVLLYIIIVNKMIIRIYKCTYVYFQSEEDKQLQEELNMLVERLQVGILLFLVTNFCYSTSLRAKLCIGLECGLVHYELT